MSTHYAPLEKIPACDLFDGRLDPFGVSEHFVPGETSHQKKCLTDGRNYIWVNVDDQGFVDTIVRYGGNAPRKILEAIADSCNADIVSEHEPRYWGFNTRDELDAYEEKMAKESEEKFHVELLKYLHGEANNIRPGTIEMIHAEIAKDLVENDPRLLLPINKEKLCSEIQSIYDNKDAFRITLTPEEVAAAEMSVTHEDDLPNA
jgi:hypothetical protein